MVEASATVLDAGKSCIAGFIRPFMYLYNYNTNLIDLQEEVRKLTIARDEVQRKVTAAERNVEEIKQNVKHWQQKVDSIIDEAVHLIMVNAENPRCFGGLCRSCSTRYRQSKMALRLMWDDIDPLLQQEKEFDQVSHPTIQQEMWLRSNEDYLAFESRRSTESNVWEALIDKNIDMMGVYGMGGIGKTTLVQEIGRKAEKDKLFDEIVFVEVTENLDVKKIQTKIADKLGVRFNNESERASKLYERLRMGMKILVILDNVWEDLDLRTVGIPSGVDRGGCKLLLTTRKLNVLVKMGSVKNIGMNYLNEEEAWRLFMKIAGNVIQRHELNSLSKDVCKECGGLPVVICTIAKALMNVSEKFRWADTLRALRMPLRTKFSRLLEKEYSKIKLSYDYLEDDEVKKIFIISSLMENDTSISDLLKNIVSLGIFEGDDLTIEEARNRLNSVVKELKDSCLLLDGSTKERFSMHDIVRDVAVTCAYIDYDVFAERNHTEKEWKDIDRLRKCTIISLVGNNNITQLCRDRLYLPELEFFNRSKMASPFEIPEDFFMLMPNLKVLNFFGMQRSMLPRSLVFLEELQTLCLDGSNIEDVTIIGKLRKLKVLSLRHSFIKELPTEIGQLTRLMILDLSNCGQLKCLAPNVISQLFQLEELYITGHQIQWKVEIIEEFKHLTRLTTLKLDSKDDIALPRFFFLKKLERYEISTGVWPLLITEHEFARVLKLKFISTFSLKELERIKDVEVLWLAELSDVENDLYNDRMRPLFEAQDIFPDLKILALIHINSRKIWDSQLPTSSYQNLTQLILRGCPNLLYAFPSSMARSIQQLQHLEIRDCQDLKEIVAKEEGANADFTFVSLHLTSLKLENLPQLTAFYPEILNLRWPMLKELVVINCDKFSSKYLSFQENDNEGETHISAQNSLFSDYEINSGMRILELDSKLRKISWRSQSKTLEIKYDDSANIPLGLVRRFENLENLELDGCGYKEIFSCGKNEKQMQITLMPSSASFQNLEVLRLDRCYKLTTLMTPSTAGSLVQLREMSIERCEMVIEIVENEGDATMCSEIIFTNLKKLSLKQLESLTCFCFGNYSFNFPSLEELIIRNCPNMKTFSQGILNTPKLPKINYESVNESYWEREEIEVHNWENDLNTTIQGLYKKQGLGLLAPESVGMASTSGGKDESTSVISGHF